MSTVSPRISVVIVVRDAPEVEGTLALLAPQVAAVGAECLVIDSSEGRMGAIASRYPWVRWIDYPAPLDGRVSIAGQRNAGIRAARGGVIVFIDAGCEPVEGWLAAITAPLQDGHGGATCGPIRSKRPGVYTVINDLPDGATAVPAPTGNLAFTRALIEQIGGFDERFDYGSDTDWSLRAAAAGTVFTSTPSRYTCTTDRAGARTLSTTLLPTTLDEAGDDAAARTSAGSCDPIFGLVKRLEPGIGAVARAERGTVVVGAGVVVVGTVVVGAGAVVVGTIVAGASGASSPESPPPPPQAPFAPAPLLFDPPPPPPGPPSPPLEKPVDCPPPPPEPLRAL